MGFHNFEHAGLGERLVSHGTYVRQVDRMYLVSAAASALHVAATDSVVFLLGRSSDCLSQDVTAWPSGV